MLEHIAARIVPGTQTYFSPVPTFKSEFNGIVGHRQKGLPFKRLDMSYRIDSPSSRGGERTYKLNYERYMHGESTLLEESQLAGYVAEQIMRIRITEFFRRIEKPFGITKFEFLKNDSITNPTVDSARYQGKFIGRHNVEFYKKNPETGVVSATRVCEYDGVLLYSWMENGTEKKGAIICESKIGSIGSFVCKTPKEKEDITKKFIAPAQEVFCDREISFLFARPLSEGVTPIKKQVRKSNNNLIEHMKNKGLKTIILPFEEEASQFWRMARHAQALRDHYDPEIILNDHKERGHTLYYPNDETRYILQKGEIIEIAERHKRTWTIMYEDRRKNKKQIELKRGEINLQHKQDLTRPLE